jgi:hypothetical protein
LTEIISFNSDIVNEIYLKLVSDDLLHHAYVRVRYYSTSETSEWDVILNGLPGNETLHGREVVAVWTCSDIANDGVFYTDSNALEMQKRVVG